MLLDTIRTLARANRLANHRLHAAVATLPPGGFEAPRAGFFPSIRETLNHILIVDWFYVGALHAEPDHRRAFDRDVPFDDARDLADAQRAVDERLIAWCDRAADDALEAVVSMDRGAQGFQRDRARHVLMHLLTHQIHHRGQAHAMLSGAGVKPPQLDEFLMPSEARFREADLAELGWTEGELFRRP